MRRNLVGLMLLFAVVLLVSPAATAESFTVTLNGCTTCMGSSFTLTVTPTGVAGQYTVTLTIDTSTFSGPSAATQITAVEFKIGNSVASATLDSFSINGIAQATTGWQVTSGPLANSCVGVNDGFVCTQVASGNNNLAPLGSGNVLQWTWTVNLPPGTPLNLEIHIGAKYNNATGDQKGWIVSESVVIPEPGTMALFGLGLAGIGGMIRRQRTRKQISG